MTRTCAGMLVLLACAGCTVFGGPQPAEVGTTRGVFHGRWWNYYERGSSYLVAEQYENAVADFGEALGGRATDTWRARTYGLHFVEYFPNRELGVAYFYQGNLDAAEEYLNLSLSQIDTARAHDYLDRVQEARIARGDVQDSAEPVVQTSVVADALIADRLLPIDITASDDTGVRAVTVNGRRLHQRGSARELTLSDSLLLTEGTNSIAITVTDLAGKTVTETLPVRVDLTGPTVGIVTPMEGAVIDADSVSLRVAAVDANGIVAVSVNGRRAGEVSGERVEAGGTYPLIDGENRFNIIARDAAGNETATALVVFRSAATSAAAMQWQFQQRKPIRLALAGELALVELLAQTEDSKPAIDMRSPTPGAVYHHNRTLRVYGQVVSDANITTIQVNGEPSDISGTPNETFKRDFALDEATLEKGEAILNVTVHAEDAAGKAGDVNYEVVVRPITLNTAESKMPIAVLAFEASAPPPLDIAQQPLVTASAIAQDLRIKTDHEIFKTSRFRMVERQEIEALMLEHQLSNALASEADALRLGKLLPADMFFIGSVIVRAKEAEVLVRAVSTEDGEYVEDGYVDTVIRDVTTLDGLDEGTRDLAQQIVSKFPRLSGNIVAAEGQVVIVDWSSEHGIKPHMHLKIVDEAQPGLDEYGLETEGEARLIGEAQVEKVEKSTRAHVIHVEEGTSVEEWKGKAAISM